MSINYLKIIKGVASNKDSRASMAELMSYLSSAERKRAYHAYLSMVASAVQADTANMWIYNAFEGGRINLADSIGTKSRVSIALRPGEGVVGKVLESDEAYFVNAQNGTGSSRICVPISARGAVFGVVDLKDKHAGDFTRADLDLSKSIAKALAELILSNSDSLILGYYTVNSADSTLAVAESRKSTAIVNTLASIIEMRSSETGQHSSRMRSMMYVLINKIVQENPDYDISSEDLQLISEAAVLHDIGKISVPDAILNKPGRLTDEEFTLMQEHSECGAQIVGQLRGSIDTDYLNYAYDICRYHHERWDGNGYPVQLSGDEIPIWAQAAGIIDAYDALTHKRVYKEAYSHEEAMEMINNGECGLFSPEILYCFKETAPSIKIIAETML